MQPDETIKRVWQLVDEANMRAAVSKQDLIDKLMPVLIEAGMPSREWAPPPEKPIYLYLDDMRPFPEGWKGVRTIEEAKAELAAGHVEMASLDHDLGACEMCMGEKTIDQWLSETDMASMPHCEHVGTGYDLVCWMEETGYWPKQKPQVHSANPVGAFRMRQAINRHYDKREGWK